MGNAGLVGRRWRDAQARVFAEETHCWLCGRWVDQDIPNPRDPWARSVDHIIPRDDGGPLYDRDNLRLAHIRCNTIRGNKNRAAKHRPTPSRPWSGQHHRQVTLICGPPCAGKTTWAQHHAAPDDLIVDADQIAQNVGSPHPWNHNPHHLRLAQAHWWTTVRDIGTRDTVTAWIIRCAPTAYERRRIAGIARATRTVILLPDHEVLMQRAASRPNPTLTLRTVQQWHSRYTPHRHHEIINTGTTNTQVTASRRW